MTAHDEAWEMGYDDGLNGVKRDPNIESYLLDDYYKGYKVGNNLWPKLLRLHAHVSRKRGNHND